jgi:hypothetical protein
MGNGNNGNVGCTLIGRTDNEKLKELMEKLTSGANISLTDLLFRIDTDHTISNNDINNTNISN